MPHLLPLKCFCTILCLLFLQETAASSSSSSTTTADIPSVRALDSYGNAIQLLHADAATQQGRLVIGIRTSNATWIASTVARQRHHRQDDANNDNKLLHFVNIFDSKNNNVAIVCTGIQGDAVWLLEQIQSHASSTWERYGSSLSAASVASAIQRLVRIFWDYDMENTLQRIDLKDNWARPLGVRTFVVSSSALYVVEPSGNIVQGDVLCMGKHSKELQVLLEEKIKKRGDENVQDIIVELVSSRVVEGSGVDHLLIEILSSDGQLERRRVKLK